MNGIARIAAERKRQIEAEGRTAAHDDGNDAGEMSGAGAAYALAAACQLSPYTTPLEERPDAYPHTWDEQHWKPNEDPVRNLEKAGALIAAEIDRELRSRGDLTDLEADTIQATEDKRTSEARAYLAAAIQRRDFCREAMETEEEKPAPWWTAQQGTVDAMQDRINLIHALFPELREG